MSIAAPSATKCTLEYRISRVNTNCVVCDEPHVCARFRRLPGDRQRTAKGRRSFDLAGPAIRKATRTNPSPLASFPSGFWNLLTPLNSARSLP